MVVASTLVLEGCKAAPGAESRRGVRLIHGLKPLVSGNLEATNENVTYTAQCQITTLHASKTSTKISGQSECIHAVTAMARTLLDTNPPPKDAHYYKELCLVIPPNVSMRL
jgi:hypothetical protein